jgi:CheY-like chemotaxis protein
MGETVLVVDDEPAIVDLLCEVLAGAGYRVVAARDGEEALAAAQRVGPDVVLSDVTMPRLDGTELAARLAPRGIPVVLMSAQSQLPPSPTTPVLTKPFDLDAVLAVVAASARDAAPRPWRR